MTRRRTTIAAGLALAIAGSAGAASAHADPTTVRTLRTPEYVACVAVDVVHVGACVEEPVDVVRDLLLAR